MDQTSLAPTNKVGSGILAGAVVTLVVWILSLFGVDMPAEVAAALTTVIALGTAYLVQDKAPPSTPPTPTTPEEVV